MSQATNTQKRASRKRAKAIKEGRLEEFTGRCGAETRGGKECSKAAGWGTEHPGVGRCRSHGGNTPTQVKQAALIQGKQLAIQYGAPRDIEPHDALLEELARTAGHVSWLGDLVSGLEQEQMVGPVGGGSGGFPSIEPSVWIRMYQAERDHMTQVAATCIKAGIEERRVRLAEEQGQLIARVLQGVIKDLGLEDDKRVPKVIRRHLTAIEGGA